MEKLCTQCGAEYHISSKYEDLDEAIFCPFCGEETEASNEADDFEDPEIGEDYYY